MVTSDTEPVTLPEELGANIALNMVVLPGAIVTGTTRPLMLKPVPDTLACEIMVFALPPFVSVIVCELLLPVTTLPKLVLAGAAESWG